MNVTVLGTGITKFGELWNKSFYDLAQEASLEALTDAGLNIKDIDAIFVANMLFGKIDNQDHLGAVVSSLLGSQAPALRIEGACASGGLAIHTAIQSLESGIYKNVLVLGIEKMTDVSSADIGAYLMGAGSEEERIAGLTFPGLYALIARAHMQKYGTTREHMASVAVKNHYHASLNDKAQFPYEVTVEKVLKSPVISNPFTLFDASPITDGAAAVVLSSSPRKGKVRITGSAVATDTIDLANRKSLTELSATKLAAQKAYQQAGVSPNNIDVAEVHDCFTIAEILAMEDLGFCKKGEGGEFIMSGATKLGCDLPINTSGGLKACGHPVGATGVKQIIEIAHQLTGIAKKRQVKNARVGLAQNVGGTGATVTVHILEK
jgi:acetyl-CoA C-acetyltransferase